MSLHVEIIANFRVELFPRSVLNIFFLPICQDPESATIGSIWVSEQGVFNELGFKIVIMPSLEPTWILFDCSFEKSSIFNLKAMGYLQKQCKEQ